MLDFGKPIHKIDEQDLQQKLIDDAYCECRSAEYKSTWTKPPSKLARTLSAFANTEGGWLFVGVDADRHTNVAKELTGVGISTRPAETISNIARQWVDPVPCVDPRIVTLGGGKAVLVAQVREGSDPPYIDRSVGATYRRTGCVSERDQPVKDRHGLDALIQKGSDAAKLLRVLRTRTYYASLLPYLEPSALPGFGNMVPISVQLYPRIAGGPLFPHFFTEATERDIRNTLDPWKSGDWVGRWGHRQSRLVWRSKEAIGAWRCCVFTVGVDGSIECTQIANRDGTQRALAPNEFHDVLVPACETAAHVYEHAGYGGSVDVYLDAANLTNVVLHDTTIGPPPPGQTGMLDDGYAEADCLEAHKRSSGADLRDDAARERLIEAVWAEIKRFFGRDAYEPAD